jgi:hypothetical protein
MIVICYKRFSRSIIHNSRSRTDNSRSIIDKYRSIIDKYRSIIDNSRSIIDNSRSVTGNSRVMLRLVASFRIMIYYRHIFIIQAIGRLRAYSLILKLAKNY